MYDAMGLRYLILDIKQTCLCSRIECVTKSALQINLVPRLLQNQNSIREND